MVTHPTYVVGAGQAGVNVMNVLYEVADQNDDLDRFSFVAVDSDGDTLDSAPPEARRYKLEIEDDFLGEDLRDFPYLKRTMNVEEKGAKRQRPVGRYKLDNKGTFEEVRTGIRDDMRSHFTGVEVDLGPDSASFNIFYIHSLGGGTGSGTYPLVAGILRDIANDLGSDHIYMAGIGVAPVVLSPDEGSPAEFPGRPMYYPNTYAALNDLEQLEMLDFGDNDELELLVHSETGVTGTESYVFDEPPFTDYWLVGVNQRRIQGTMGTNVGPESYRGELNQTMARSLHAITQFGQSAENWAQGRPVIGTFDHSTVSVPHERVREYVELRERRANLRTQRDTEIPNEIDRIEARKAELEQLKSHLNPDEIVDEQLKEDLLARLEQQEDFLGGRYTIENKTVDEVEGALEAISRSEEYDIEADIIAADILREKLNEDGATPQIEQKHKDTIQNLWSKYNMQNVPGGANVQALETKAGMLDDHLRDTIEEHKDIVKDWDPDAVEKVQDKFPPVVGLFESEREAAQDVVDEVQNDYDELDAVQSQWGRASKMKQAVADHRQGIRGRISDRIEEQNERITELQNEQEELESDIDELTRGIESHIEDLTEARLSERIAVLPLNREPLESLDTQQLDTLDSIQDYVENGYVDGQHVRDALSDRVGFARAWENYIIDGDFSKARYSSQEYNDNYTQVSADEMWILHGEDAGEVLESVNVGTGATQNKRSGDAIQYIGDPYRIEFVSFTRRGPVSRLKLYQVLDRYANSGELEGLAGQYPDYRQAFAYLEWYGRDIQEAFDISARVDVANPPEMRQDRVDKPDLEGGELKNYIKSNGLDSYLWEGFMWDTYRAADTDRTFTGWKEALTKKNVGFTGLQEATPSPDLKAQWLAGQAEWDDVVQGYRDNLIDNTGIELQLSE